MTTFADLKKSVEITLSGLEDVKRYYAVGDRMVICLTVEVESRRRRRRALSERPPVPLACVTHFTFKDKDGEYVDLHDCTAKDLIAYAEVKGTIEKWERGEILDLPPSNATPFRPSDDLE